MTTGLKLVDTRRKIAMAQEEHSVQKYHRDPKAAGSISVIQII
jgi:hypothetical protein